MIKHCILNHPSPLAMMRSRFARFSYWNLAPTIVFLGLFTMLPSCYRTEDRTMADFDIPKAFDAKHWFQPCTVTDIERVEKALDATLPEDHKAFLLKNNAVSFRDVVARRSDMRGKHLEVGTLYGIDPNHELVGYDLLREQMGYDFPKRVPRGIIKIGDSLSGYHAICLSVRPEDYGVIYYWNPGVPWEELAEDEVPTMRYLSKIAVNFTAFWKTFEVVK